MKHGLRVLHGRRVLPAACSLQFNLLSVTLQRTEDVGKEETFSGAHAQLHAGGAEGLGPSRSQQKRPGDVHGLTCTGSRYGLHLSPRAPSHLFSSQLFSENMSHTASGLSHAGAAAACNNTFPVPADGCHFLHLHRTSAAGSSAMVCGVRVCPLPTSPGALRGFGRRKPARHVAYYLSALPAPSSLSVQHQASSCSSRAGSDSSGGSASSGSHNVMESLLTRLDVS